MRSFFKKPSAPPLTNPGIFLFFSFLVLALYGQCVAFDFVSYDDDFQIYNNLSVRQLSPASVLDIFTANTRVLGDAEAQIYANRIYIPVTFLSYQLQHALTGLSPFWFHAVNIALFIILVFLTYQLLLFWLKHKSVALLCATLFAIHPLNSEPVAWVSGRKDLLCAIFFVLGLLFYGKYTASHSKKMLFLAILVCFLSTLSKPSGGIFIMTLLAYDYCYRRPLAWRQFLLEKLLFLSAVFLPVLYSLTHYALKNNPLISIDRLLFSVGIPFFALSHAFLPLSLSAFYPYPSPLLWKWGQILLIAAGALCLTGLARLAKTESRHRLFALAFFFSALLPYVLRAAFFPDGGFTSDRYMLLPLIGLLLLLGVFFKQIHARSTHWKSYQKKFLCLLGIILTSSLAFTTHSRAAAWKNSETLSLDIVKKYPSAANAQEELGRIYQQRGLITNAAAHFKAAYLSDPATKRLIQLYELYGLNQPLITLYQKALERSPDDNRLQAGLGMVYFRLREFALAEDYFKASLTKDKYNDKLYNVLAGALYYQNKIPSAIAAWQQALAINPDYTDAANNLGAAYLALGNHKEARSLFEEVLAKEPRHKGASTNLGKLK